MNWYTIKNIETVDSPSIVVYEDRMDANLLKMLAMVNMDGDKLMPHVKTNKMPAVIKRMIEKGIHAFKASTIAEAEIVAMEKGRSVLIAHQLVGPKIARFLDLIEKYPKTKFSTLIDNKASLELLNGLASERKLTALVFVDINNGMNRSGIKVGPELDYLIEAINACSNIQFKGFHVYDGHLHDTDFEERKSKVEKGFIEITTLYDKLRTRNPEISLISGGTPSFTSHLSVAKRICSPGTCVLWDWGYADMLTEQKFDFAALLITRVISKPTEGIVTIDLGHKAVASENPIDKRVKFLNLRNYELLSQSEEHGVLKVGDWEAIQVGDVLYGLPFHICPTINLHDEVSVIDKNQNKIDTWEILARKRKIHI